MNAGGVSKACKSNGFDIIARWCRTSGKRERNTLVTCPKDVINPAKAGLIHDMDAGAQAIRIESVRCTQRGAKTICYALRATYTLREGPMVYQLVGGVTAHQGSDG